MKTITYAFDTGCNAIQTARLACNSLLLEETEGNFECSLAPEAAHLRSIQELVCFLLLNTWC